MKDNTFENNCKKLGIDPQEQIDRMIKNFNAFCEVDITKVNIKDLTAEQIREKIAKESENTIKEIDQISVVVNGEPKDWKFENPLKVRSFATELHDNVLGLFIAAEIGE